MDIPTAMMRQRNGMTDIISEPDTGDMGIIIEVKYAHDRNLDAACKAALEQIEHTGYEDDLEDEGVKNILKYGRSHVIKKAVRLCWQKHKQNSL